MRATFNTGSICRVTMSFRGAQRRGICCLCRKKSRFLATLGMTSAGGFGLSTKLTHQSAFWLLAILLAGSAYAAELPVRQVVLYKHGVGYFQRSGELRPGESAQLDFKANEMNDVLKSLTIQESGTGSVTGLRYDSSEP